MKYQWNFIWIFLAAVTMSSCLKDDCTETRTFVEFTPVYKTAAQLAEPISLEASRPLRNPGIIYFYQNYILVSEFREGIHLINNADPSNPVNEAFLQIEGNEHFAVIDNHLQANKFNALLTIDISDLTDPVEKSRIDGAFQDLWEDPSRGFQVYQAATERTQVLDCSDPNFNSVRWNNGNGGFWLFSGAVDFANFAPEAADRGGNVGTGGSTARFTISQQHLYLVSDSDLKVFNLDNPARPLATSNVNLGWGIETIYPYKDKLFIGSNSGMFIFDASAPCCPQLLSTFDHARACDPVVADDNTAYVTLRDGSLCEGFNNQLDVIDISNLTSPFLLGSYAMENPRGLALQGDNLFICEGDYGLKVMDVSNREKVKEVDFNQKVRSQDVIALPDNRLLVIGKDGLRQYDSSNPKSLREISFIPVSEQP